MLRNHWYAVVMQDDVTVKRHAQIKFDTVRLQHGLAEAGEGVLRHGPAHGT